MKYLLLKHYRGTPTPAVDFPPMDQWAPDEVDARIQYMKDFGARLERTGDSDALAPDSVFVRYDGEGRPPVVDGPFAETKDLIAGWTVIDLDSWDRAVELAGELSAAPGPGVTPIHAADLAGRPAPRSGGVAGHGGMSRVLGPGPLVPETPRWPPTCTRGPRRAGPAPRRARPAPRSAIT